MANEGAPTLPGLRLPAARVVRTGSRLDTASQHSPAPVHLTCLATSAAGEGEGTPLAPAERREQLGRNPLR
jgi:hypothetical protein